MGGGFQIPTAIEGRKLKPSGSVICYPIIATGPTSLEGLGRGEGGLKRGKRIKLGRIMEGCPFTKKVFCVEQEYGWGFTCSSKTKLSRGTLDGYKKNGGRNTEKQKKKRS